MKAFPHGEVVNFIEGEIAPKITKPSAGMDLRDYFAAKALEGMLAFGGWNPKFNMDFSEQPYAEKGLAKDCIANSCYEYADAMMKAREL